MTFHKLALATILTSATALGAHAQNSALGDNAIEEKGHEMENAARADEAPGIDETTDYDAESYGIRGDEVVSVGPEQDATEQGVNDNLAPNESETTSLTEPENILNAAKQGTPVYSVTGETIGAVAATRDDAEEGAIVIVDVSEQAGLPVPALAFPIATLQVVKEGGALEYHSRLAHLEEHIEQVQGG
ncbi:MAG: hypothetical protein RIA08_07600 [Roseovarius sp.]|uniref:hypothetical protein n=1 Tax=Roseovarius sp. TaxID=1486281 RepID=UPI0032EAC581